MRFRESLRRSLKYVHGGRPPRRPSLHGRQLFLESLEDRLVPSTITWTNRGVTTGDNNDRFNDVFGSNAEPARRVIDAAITSWTRVVTNFNQPSGGNNIDVNISMATSGGGAGYQKL